MSEQKIEGILDTSLDKLKSLVDVNTIIGEQIVTPNGTVVIPVSKVTFGFASGGTDLPTAKPNDPFAGGSGGGVTIQPLAFLVIAPDGNVRLLQMEKFHDPIDRAVNMMPEVIDKVTGMFSKSREKAPAEPVSPEPQE